MITPLTKEWGIVNSVYEQDGRTSYGYKIRNKDGVDTRIISMRTANKMMKVGTLEFCQMSELTHLRVNFDHVENTEGLGIEE